MTRSPMRQPHRRATDAAIAVRPGVVILAMVTLAPLTRWVAIGAPKVRNAYSYRLADDNCGFWLTGRGNLTASARPNGQPLTRGDDESAPAREAGEALSLQSGESAHG